MTPKQKKLLNFIASYTEAHGFSPSYDEMMQEMGVVRSSIAKMIDRLIEAGHIERRPYVARGLKVVARPSQDDAVKVRLKMIMNSSNIETAKDIAKMTLEGMK